MLQGLVDRRQVLAELGELAGLLFLRRRHLVAQAGDPGAGAFDLDDARPQIRRHLLAAPALAENAGHGLLRHARRLAAADRHIVQLLGDMGEDLRRTGGPDARRLDGGPQGQQVRLDRHLIQHGDELARLPEAGARLLHSRDHLAEGRR